jgi:hypothetical protein
VITRILVFAICFTTLSSYAQNKKKYSFLFGFEDRYVPPKDTTKNFIQNLFTTGKFSGSVGFLTGRLIYYDFSTNDFNTRVRYASITELRYRVYKELFISTTIFGNIDRQNLPFWVSDYFYSIKWFNWRPHTLSFGYDNFIDNRFDDNSDFFVEKFLQGFMFVSYNLPLSKKWVNKIRLDESTNIMFTPAIRFHPTFRNEMNEILGSRVVLNLNCRATIWKKIYGEFGLFYYPDITTRVAWDPDFIYGFGYSDWRPWKFSVTYGNWVANRFNMQKEIPGYGFWDGNFSVLFNYKF